jgi:hypothetical protein
VTSGVTSWLVARRASDTWRAVAFIVVAIVVANCAYIFFGYESSPIWWTAGVASHSCAWSCGIPTVDPNVGFITQPLGRLAAMDLLHGHVPWWNYFEGMGQPLAGEMQSAALLPLVVLFVFPAGLLLFHLSLQIIAGVSTYFLVRRLGVGPTLAALGGVLFAVNGTYAWIGNAAINPLAFLPMMILGIEIIIERNGSAQRAAWTVLAIGLALSIYAGFPETAYLDGLLALGWAITRVFSLPRSRRVVAMGRLTTGGVVGAGLSLPVLVAFYDFVKDANIGAHAARGLSSASTPAHTLPLLVNPYLGGTLFAGPSATPNNLLGYFTASVAVFALVGVFGRRLRPLRWYLGAWVTFVILGVLDLLFVRRLWDVIPAMKTVAFSRYVWPTAEFAVIILAVLGLSDLIEYASRRSGAKWAVLVVFAVCTSGVFLITPLGGNVHGSLSVAVKIMIVIPFVALVVIGYGLHFVNGRAFVALAVAVMSLESVVFFAVPLFRSPSSITIASGSIEYLQQHEGLGRFVSLGGLNPNWGSQFSLNEINAVDLPLPTNFTNYIHSDLAPTILNPRVFVLPYKGATVNDFAAHIANYESLGVAYLVTAHRPLSLALQPLGLTLVASDTETNLYSLPHPANFYSTALASCIQTNAAVDHVTLTCPAATTLTRLELTMKGWSAHVNGVTTSITSSNDLTQTIAIPAGTSIVSFDFLPPHENLAVLLAAASLIAMAGSWLPRKYLPRRRSAPGAEPASD